MEAFIRNVEKYGMIAVIVIVLLLLFLSAIGNKETKVDCDNGSLDIIIQDKNIEIC